MTTAVDLVRRFRHLRALVIGDAMLDTYLEGTAARLCSEGPVPVVRKLAESQKQLLTNLEETLPQCDLIVVSDYGYGVASEELIDRLRMLRTTHPGVLLVDSKALHHFRNAGATVITPNLLEARLLVEHERVASS